MKMRFQSLTLLIALSCGVGHRLSSDPMLLWLWYRPMAITPIQLLAWKLPYAVGVALKRQQNKWIKIKKNYSSVGVSLPFCQMVALVSKHCSGLHIGLLSSIRGQCSIELSSLCGLWMGFPDSRQHGETHSSLGLSQKSPSYNMTPPAM